MRFVSFEYFLLFSIPSSVVHPFHFTRNNNENSIISRSRTTSILLATTKQDDNDDDIASMRVRQIQAELKESGVSYTDCFDRESLVTRLMETRRSNNDNNKSNACQKEEIDDDSLEKNPICCPPPEEQEIEQNACRPNVDDEEKKKESSNIKTTSSSSTSSSSSSSSSSSFDREAVTKELRKMRVAELRTECGKRNIRWATMIDKDDLVRALVNAREVASKFSPSGVLTPGQVGEITEKELDIELSSLNNSGDSTPLLLDVYATWCGPCKMIAPELVNVASELNDRLRIAKIDSDKYPNKCQQLNVNAFPTLILFGKDGKEIQRFEGALMKQQILNAVEPYL